MNTLKRNARRYQRGNLKPQIEEWQTMQWSTEKGQINIQLSTHHFAENYRLSNTNITKDQGSTQV
jgi:hypothetical protein